MRIQWSKSYPTHSRILGYWRLLIARYRFHERLGLKLKNGWPTIGRIEGYAQKIAAMRGKHAGRRIFLLGNGPSLQKMDLSPLKNELTIASNGFYEKGRELGFLPTYMLFEDIEQTEMRRRNISSLKGTMKILALHNAYAVTPSSETLFMNVRWADQKYWEYGPLFSEDLSSVGYLGATITYLGFQLAYHLGCTEIYILGVDHNYGELPKLFKPGKIVVTPENLELVRKCHFSSKYYNVGDSIGVPNVSLQDRAYKKANAFLSTKGIRVRNVGLDSHLNAFEKADYATLFKPVGMNTAQAGS